MVGRVRGKRKGYLVQKDEGRSLGLRKVRAPGLSRKSQGGQKGNKRVSGQGDKWHKHRAVNDWWSPAPWLAI